MAQERASVIVNGKDIASYLYGSSPRIFDKDRPFLSEDLLIIRKSVGRGKALFGAERSEEHTSELQSQR